jgi:carbonyl reductase 1
VIFHPLDVQSEESSRNIAQWLSQNYGGIDILMNNAGVAKKDVNVENADLVLGTNYYGVKQVTNALMPLLRNSTHDARIVVTGS